MIYGVSANTRGGWVSLAGARALGYEPLDNAEDYAAELIAIHGEPDPDDRTFKYLGGDFTSPALDAPPQGRRRCGASAAAGAAGLSSCR